MKSINFQRIELAQLVRKKNLGVFGVCFAGIGAFSEGLDKEVAE
jgi:hypothetical protein